MNFRMGDFLITPAFLLSVSLTVLHAAEASKLPAAKEADQCVQADGRGWRLDKAKIGDPARPRVLLIGDSILNGYKRRPAADAAAAGLERARC